MKLSCKKDEKKSSERKREDARADGGREGGAKKSGLVEEEGRDRGAGALFLWEDPMHNLDSRAQV